jgi:hypothetical protein
LGSLLRALLAFPRVLQEADARADRGAGAVVAVELVADDRTQAGVRERVEQRELVDLCITERLRSSTTTIGAGV